MKRIILLLFFGLFLSDWGIAEEKKQSDEGHILNLEVDIPEIPAANSLGINNNHVLKPTTPSEFGILLSNFFDGSTISIPSSFAIEVAPFLLSKAKIKNLKEYLSRNDFDNLRISLASIRDSVNNSYNQSIGFRMTFEFGLKEKIHQYAQYLEDKSVKMQEYEQEFFKIKGWGSGYEPIGNEQKELEEYENNKFESTRKSLSIENYWNYHKLDVAIASVWNSKDSVGRETKLKSIQLWATYAGPIPISFLDSKNAQMMAGVNLRYFDDIKTGKQLLNGSLGIRFNFGVENFKFFVEAEYDNNELDNSEIADLRQHFLVNGGIELKLTTNTWFVYNLNYKKEFEKGITKPVISSNLDFRYNIAEIINVMKK